MSRVPEFEAALYTLVHEYADVLGPDDGRPATLTGCLIVTSWADLTTGNEVVAARCTPETTAVEALGLALWVTRSYDP